MNKAVKLLTMVFVFLCGFCVFNIDNVKAVCYCYYETGVEQNSSGTTTAVVNYSKYMLKMAYDKNKADVVEYCRYFSTNSFTWPVPTDWDGQKECSGLNRGDPFNVDSAHIASQKCSKKACADANLYLLKQGYGWKDYKAITEFRQDKTIRFNSMSKKDYEAKAQNNDLAKDDVKQAEDLTDILDWGKTDSNSLYKHGKVDDPCTIIDTDLKDLLQKVLLWISIAGIVILLLMSIFDFIKAVVSSDSDNTLKNAFKRTVIRAACTVILLLLPMIIGAIIDIVNNNNVYREEDGSYKIGANGEPLCKIDKFNK